MDSEREAGRALGWALAGLVVIAAVLIVGMLYALGFTLSAIFIGSIVGGFGAAHLITRWIHRS